MGKSTALQLPRERLAPMKSPVEASKANMDGPHTSETNMTSSCLNAKTVAYEKTFALPELPYELWCIIFTECRRMDPWTPTIISLVCHHWRHVAIGHRALWNHINLGRRETGLDRASVWAERSNLLPIDLVVRCSQLADRRDMIPWLQKKGSRIRSISVLHMHQGEQNHLLSSLPPFQFMQKLRILGLEEFNLDLRLIAQLLRGSPRLYSLSLAGVSVLDNPEALINIADRLTHLSFGEFSQIDHQSPLQADVVLAVISACTSLQSLECHALSDESDDEPPTAVLPYLSSISIGDSHETCIILRYLHAPRLRSVRLVHGRRLDENEEEVGTPMDGGQYDYAILLIDCLRDLHLSCSPLITKVAWDRSILDIRVLDHCTEYLRDMEELQCYGLETPSRLGKCSFLWENFEGAIRPYPRLRSISLTGCNLIRSELDSIMKAISLRGPPYSKNITELIVEDCKGMENMYWSRALNEGVKNTCRGSSRRPNA